MPDPITGAELHRLFERHGFTSRSTTMLPVLRRAHKAAVVSDVTVLLEGETGTGKQVLAQAIHQLDEKRKSFPFVTVHCSTVNEGLAESELFGHQRGAFSGAVREREGLFQAAERGTLFLDDVNELPLPLQPKLLDVLQRKVVRCVGSDCEERVNVRVIAASNQPLAQVVEQRRFRADLYHRLNVVRLCLPPLRERGEDLAALLLAFAQRHRHIYPCITGIDSGLVEHLKSHAFRGNVRELEHAVERMLFAKTEGSNLQLSDWQESADPDQSGKENDLVALAADQLWTAIFQCGLPYGEAFRRLEFTLLQTALRTGDHTRREMATRLHTSERTFYHKLKAHHLSRHSVAD